jgi:ABC-2 type transport system ATP-binding protein
MIYLYDYVENSEKVSSVLINAGLLIKRMNISNISLEDYYLQLVRGGE